MLRCPLIDVACICRNLPGLQRELKKAVEGRTAGAGTAVDINVSSHPMQRYAVWYGASLLGLSEGFSSIGERAGLRLQLALAC